MVSVLVFVVFPFVERGADDSVLVERGSGVHMDLQPGGWDLVANIPGVVKPVGQHARGSADDRGGDLRNGGDAQSNGAGYDSPDRVLVAVVRGRVRVTGAQDQTAATESVTPGD